MGIGKVSVALSFRDHHDFELNMPTSREIFSDGKPSGSVLLDGQGRPQPVRVHQGVHSQPYKGCKAENDPVTLQVAEHPSQPMFEVYAL